MSKKLFTVKMIIEVVVETDSEESAKEIAILPRILNNELSDMDIQISEILTVKDVPMCCYEKYPYTIDSTLPENTLSYCINQNYPMSDDY